MSKPLSTYEREILDPKFKKGVEKKYRELILSELAIALKTNKHKSVESLKALLKAII